MIEVWFPIDIPRGAPLELPEEVREWLDESGAEHEILHAWWPKGSNQAVVLIGFATIEDVTLFKMRWLDR